MYRKKSTFKGAKEEDFWYSATRSDGSAVSCVFKCPVTTESKAFEISNVIGNLKRKEVFKTEILNRFRFPEISGEKFIPEGLIWNRIGKEYNLRYINKAIYR